MIENLSLLKGSDITGKPARVLANWLFENGHTPKSLVEIKSHVKGDDLDSMMSIAIKKIDKICGAIQPYVQPERPAEITLVEFGHHLPLDLDMRLEEEWGLNGIMVYRILKAFRAKGGGLFMGNNYQRIEHIFKNISNYSVDPRKVHATIDALKERGVIIEVVRKKPPLPVSLNPHPPDGLAKDLLVWANHNFRK